MSKYMQVGRRADGRKSSNGRKCGGPNECGNIYLVREVSSSEIFTPRPDTAWLKRNLKC